MMTQQPVQPTFMMTVKLEAQQWNAVIGALGKAPYEVVAPLINAMGEQLQQQAQQAQAEIGNGLDTSPPSVNALS